MPFTKKLDADVSLVRTGQVGLIIRQLKTLAAGKANVHFNNQTRQFEITAVKREFCDTVAERIVKAMSDVVQGRFPQREQEQEEWQQRPTAVFRIPKGVSTQQRLALQRQFVKIARFVDGGVYLQLLEKAGLFVIKITARERRSVLLALQRLDETLTSILRAKSRTASKQAKQADSSTTHSSTGQFHLLMEDEQEELQEEEQDEEQSEIQRNMMRLTQGALTGGRASREFNRTMHLSLIHI